MTTWEVVKVVLPLVGGTVGAIAAIMGWLVRMQVANWKKQLESLDEQTRELGSSLQGLLQKIEVLTVRADQEKDERKAGLNSHQKSLDDIAQDVREALNTVMSRQVECQKTFVTRDQFNQLSWTLEKNDEKMEKQIDRTQKAITKIEERLYGILQK